MNLGGLKTGLSRAGAGTACTIDEELRVFVDAPGRAPKLARSTRGVVCGAVQARQGNAAKLVCGARQLLGALGDLVEGTAFSAQALVGLTDVDGQRGHLRPRLF